VANPDLHSAALPGVVARDLSPDLQRKVWNRVKTTQPALAQVLGTDPFIARLRAELGASPVFSSEFVRQAKVA